MPRPKGNGKQPTVTKTCEQCSVSFQALRYQEKTRRFCSMDCAHLGHRGTKGFWKGVKRPDMAEARKGKGNPAWKGDDIKYGGIHLWLRREYGKDGACEHCGIVKVLDWALKSGKEYKRRRSFFLHLCRSCHQKYDYKHEMRKPYRKETKGKPC